MYLCMYMHMYVCMYMFMCTYMCIGMCMCMCIGVCKCICTCICFYFYYLLIPESILKCLQIYPSVSICKFIAVSMYRVVQALEFQAMEAWASACGGFSELVLPRCRLDCAVPAWTFNVFGAKQAPQTARHLAIGRVSGVKGTDSMYRDKHR